MMKKLKVNFKNCFGIEKLENHEFDFTNSNVNLIYAKNGSMKTSFAKIFEKYQLGKEGEVKDEIHSKQPVLKEIKVIEDDNNERNINKKEIYVIKSFRPFYESKNIATLLVNNELKESINEVLSLKENLLKLLEKDSGINIKGITGGKTIFKLEPQILKDFSIINESFLKKLNVFDSEENLEQYYNIRYSTIFDAIDIIKKDEFQNNIEAFLEKSEEIYNSYSFLKKGEFTLAKLKKIQGELNKQSFFVNGNKIKLDGEEDEIDKSILEDKIKEIERELQETDEFKTLEKLLQKPKGIPLKDIIESNPFIIRDLKQENLEKLKIKLWESYFQKNEEEFNELKTKYSEIEEEINLIDINNTIWREVIDIFNDRFFLPFKMDIGNIESSIMGEALPKVIFKFPKDGNFNNNDESNWTELNRESLESKDVLSQGERRALYLLNIIFDIETIKRNNQQTLFIVDDIADSFDYKNKYAIVEYLRDLSQEENFYLIILTHNFDFFRFVSSRLDVKRDNKFHSRKINNSEIKIEREYYQNNPFNTWKKVLKEKTLYGINYTNIDAKKHILALIPFIRNLIDFGVDKKINTFGFIDEDKMLLTSLLHIKNETQNIEIKYLKEIYKEYIGKNDFDTSINDNDKVYNLIFDIADNYISNDDIKLENKIILAIAIRLKAEEFMINKISDSAFVDTISGNQTRELFDKIIEDSLCNNDELKILEKVNIMTPENIHLNSFMYEPILDMDILELKKLYEEVKQLNDL